MSEKREIPVYFEMTQKREITFRSDVIFRYAVNDDKDAVLKTEAGMEFIDSGETVWKLSLSKETGIVPSVSPDRVLVRASWYDASEAKEAGIKIIAGDDASVFEGLGTILVPDDFRIPTAKATKENVKFYGLELIKDGGDFTVASDEYDIVLMKYDYSDNYRDDFLTQLHGGGGFYVERHNFPHIHIPLSEESRGYIVIGKQHTKNSFSFTAFQIPHGHALYTPSNTIHGDGTLIGKYAISVAKNSAKADTVLFYNEHTISKADGVVPK